MLMLSDRNKDIMSQANGLWIFVNEMIDHKNPNFEDDYCKIVYIYYRIFCQNYRSFDMLIKDKQISPAIVLLRTMLELHIKSHFLFFIERGQSSVSDFLDGKKPFPNFFKMAEALENYQDESGKGFEGSFDQFTKKNLASYEKFSWFSHGKGDYLKAFFMQGKMIFTQENITELLLTAKGLFETLSLLLFFSQNKLDSTKILLEKIADVDAALGLHNEATK